MYFSHMGGKITLSSQPWFAFWLPSNLFKKWMISTQDSYYGIVHRLIFYLILSIYLSLWISIN